MRKLSLIIDLYIGVPHTSSNQADSNNDTNLEKGYNYNDYLDDQTIEISNLDITSVNNSINPLGCKSFI